MKVTEAYPSLYLKAADLKGQNATLTIKSVTMEQLNDGQKPVVFFTDAKKGLVINVTNANSIAAEHGDDMDGWTGKKIELFSMPVTFQGRTVDAVRVRPVKSVKEAALDAQAPLDDPIDL